MTPKQWLTVGALAVKNFVLAGNLVSLRWLTQPRQLVGFNAETLFLYKALARRRGLPGQSVFQALGASNELNVRLGALTSDAPWFGVLPSYTQDIVSLAALCQIVRPHTVFEIGTARGYTTLHLALNSPDDCKIYTLDLPRNYTAPPALETTAMDEFQVGMYVGVDKYLFEDSSVASKITCLYSDSATFDFAPYAQSVDLFFIDGAHSYAYVRSDTLNALKCCHSGSVIAWHDYGRAGLNGVSGWLHELAQQYQVYAIPGGSLAFMRVP